MSREICDVRIRWDMSNNIRGTNNDPTDQN